MQPKVAIVIVNWNGFEDTKELLGSLEPVTYKNYAIYIVDNNSAGDDAAKLKSCFGDRIVLIENKINAGFTGGNNIGIQAALSGGAEYVLLLNNDTIVETGFLDILVNSFNSRDDIGITAPRIYYYYDRELIWSSGGKISLIRGSGFALTNVQDHYAGREIKPVTFVSGCCMLIKKEVFLKTGYFDENFFLYLEDTDFCFRVAKQGYRILEIPAARIYHKVKASSKKNSASTLYYETRNRLYFSKKNFPGFFPLTFIYISATMVFKSIFWIIAGRKENIILIYKSFRDFLSGRMGKKTI